MELTLQVFVRDFAIALPLVVYALLVIFVITKELYHFMIKKGLSERKAVYFNRKAIHILVGGLISAIIPFIFIEPFVPFLFAIGLGAYLHYKRKNGKLMKWFQLQENSYEVNFAFAWGFAILFLWLYLNNPMVAMLPPMLISIGDGITGIVRNIVFGKRTKHWAGNLAMAALMIPLGYMYAGPWGMIASAFASIVERYEINPVDDNVLIVLTSSLILVVGKFFSFNI